MKYAPTLAALALLLAGSAQAAVVARAPVVTVRPAAPVARPSASAPRVSTAAPIMRRSPTTSSSSNSASLVPLYVAAGALGLAATHSSTSQASSASPVQVATPLLTVCTIEEVAKAKAWQEDCKQLDEVQETYCPLLSYFRYCHEAAPGDIRGLKPVSDRYRHVYLRETPPKPAPAAVIPQGRAL